jgi:primosomal protein N' (replication factor Y)
VNLRLDRKDAGHVERYARELGAIHSPEARPLGLGEDAVLGPAPAPLARVRGRHRWQVLLRAADVRALRALARIASTRTAALRRARVRLVIDVDPYGML